MKEKGEKEEKERKGVGRACRDNAIAPGKELAVLGPGDI